MPRWILLISCLLSAFCHADVQPSKARNILLIGPPGSGKGAIAQNISKTEGLPIISVSAALRKLPEDDPMYEAVKQSMDSGAMVPDEVVERVMKAELAQPKYAAGAIFDGFPRTLKQVSFFENNNMQIDIVVVLFVDDDVVVKRIEGRRVHLPSGRVYHVDSMPPKVSGKDDVTGEPLVQRSDDTEHIIRKRINDYREETQPVVAWAIFNQTQRPAVVQHVVIVDANGPFNKTWKYMCAKLRIEEVALNGCPESSD